MKNSRIICAFLSLALTAAATGCSSAPASSAALSAAPAGSASGAPSAPAWVPEKPIEFMVANSAGGGSDVFARTVAKIVADNKLCPQPIVVNDKPGGSGAIGFQYMKEKGGDAYTLGIVSSSYYTAPLTEHSPVSPDDFVCVAHLCKDPLLMVANSQAPFSSVEELLAYAKANPGKLSGAGSGNMSDDAIACYTLRDSGGIDIKYVPFTSGGDVLTNVLGHHVDFAFISPIEGAEQIKSGSLKAIATTADVRLKNLFPDVPTFMEKGVDVNLQQSRGFVMQKDAPKEAVQYYSDLMEQVSKTPEWEKYVTDNAMVNQFMNAEDYAVFSDQLNETYKKYVSQVASK